MGMSTKLDPNAPADPTAHLRFEQSLQHAQKTPEKPAKVTLNEPALVAPPKGSAKKDPPPAVGNAPMSAKEVPAALRHLEQATKDLAAYAKGQDDSLPTYQRHVQKFDETAKGAQRLLAAHPEKAPQLVKLASHLSEIAQSTIGVFDAIPAASETKARHEGLSHLSNLLNNLAGHSDAAASLAKEVPEMITGLRAAAEDGRMNAPLFAGKLAKLSEAFARTTQSDDPKKLGDTILGQIHNTSLADAPPFIKRALDDLSHALQQNAPLSHWHEQTQAGLQSAALQPEEREAMRMLLNGVAGSYSLDLVAPTTVIHPRKSKN